MNTFDKNILQDVSGEPILFSVPPILKLETVNVFRTEIDEEHRIKKAMEMKEIARKQKERLIKEENDKQLKAEQLNESKTDLKNKTSSKKPTSSAKKPKKTKKVSKK